MHRGIYESIHEQLRATVSTFIEREVAPHYAMWEEEGVVDRSLFSTAAAQGLLAFEVPERFGGLGLADFRFNAVLNEAFQAAAFASVGLSLSLHNDICLPYFTGLANEEQQQRWLPGVADGTLITAIAMTEPDAGSDLAGIRTRAERRGDTYVVNGNKTFITNGINADLVVVAVKTDPSARHGGISLLVLERGMEGFERGRKLRKVGLLAQDTAELHLQEVEVPVANRLGEEGAGFSYLAANLPQERLSIAISAVAAARAALSLTLEHVRARSAFGSALTSFQHVQFELAELATEIDVTEAFVDRCTSALVDGVLTSADAAKAKWWATESQKRVVDRCVQLFGGYGYMLEYPIARMYTDARVTTIYGGTTEIMKSIIAKDLGLR